MECNAMKMETAAEVGCGCHGWNKLHARGEDELAVDSKLQGRWSRCNGAVCISAVMEMLAFAAAMEKMERHGGCGVTALVRADGGAWWSARLAAAAVEGGRRGEN
ncbi:hypothetical protein DEO72_LG5g1273 [Vigna unguiculata]|uniref:Uncharacterized protein n=1 Tax=Vigna unguiculata TaxID=3917 RepID=A0A4D6LXW4_VIGUN|nr:hypothetical protein DEO72_LG5g1273 [Vigna unguiculata]